MELLTSSMIALPGNALSRFFLLCLRRRDSWTRVKPAIAPTGERVTAFHEASVQGSRDLDLFRSLEFPCSAKVHHEQHRVPQDSERMGKRALPLPAYSVIVESIAYKTPMILRYRNAYTTRQVHPAVHAVPAERMYRAMRQAFTHHKIALEE
jgi:hypothetical protein